MKRLPVLIIFAAAIAVILLVPPPPAAAKTVPYEWTGVERIVAIGDVHGAYDNLVAILETTGLLNEQLEWIGGKTHLVQLGDIVDRGPRSRDCMDLLMKLEKQAKKAGGYVHVLTGNHEVMNIVGILDHTPPEELAVYNDRQARRTRERAFQVYYKEREEDARAEGEDRSSKDEIRADFDKTYLPGYFGHRLAFGVKGRYGKWIRGHNVAILINDIVFSHGDWSEEISALGIDEVNQRVRDELSGELPLQEGISFHLMGPLQYRGLAEVQLTREQQESFEDRVNRILANLDAKRMVVGHTVTQGTIEPRFGGKHISVDVGMNELYRGGHQVALVIEADVCYAVHSGGRVELPAFLDQRNYFDYLEKVAAVDPENVNVQQSLAEEFVARGDLERARIAVERLFQIEKPMPFPYRRILGDLYRKLDEESRAREQYLLYVEQLQAVAQQNPNNPHLRNTLARFCIERELFLDRAEMNIRKALEIEPERSAFLTTLARLQFARKEYTQAIRTLEKVEREDPSYEALYYLGLSYVELDDSDQARNVFERAIERDPERPEARDELRKLNESSHER